MQFDRERICFGKVLGEVLSRVWLCHALIAWLPARVAVIGKARDTPSVVTPRLHLGEVSREGSEPLLARKGAICRVPETQIFQQH